MNSNEMKKRREEKRMKSKSKYCFESLLNRYCCGFSNNNYHHHHLKTLTNGFVSLLLLLLLLLSRYIYVSHCYGFVKMKNESKKQTT